jgi:hypothetical protein
MAPTHTIYSNRLPIGGLSYIQLQYVHRFASYYSRARVAVRENLLQHHQIFFIYFVVHHKHSPGVCLSYIVHAAIVCGSCKRAHMYVCIRVCVFMYVCVCACMCSFMNVCLYACVCMYAYMDVCMYVYTYTHTNTHTYIPHIYMCMHIYMCRIHIHTYIHTYIYIYPSSKLYSTTP